MSFNVNRVEVDPVARLAVCQRTGAALRLTPIEARLLSLLRAEREGVAYHVILPRVWGMRPDIESHRLEQTVYRIRNKWREHFQCELPLLVRDHLYLLAA